MMNYSKTIILASLLLAASCTQMENEKEPFPVDEVVMITTKVGGASASGEAAVSNLQLFVFDSGGKFEIKGSGSSSTIELGCSKGRKTVWALAGAPELSVESEDELLSAATRLEDNAPGAFVMAGSRSLEVSGPADVDITVKRYVAKVSLGRIINSLNGAYASKELVIRGVYLLNVAANTTYGISSPTEWYNRMAKESTPADELISRTGLSAVVPSGGSCELGCVFYPYPNPTQSNANGGLWSERHTKLVVEAGIGGEICYYPVVLPVLQRNRTYTISDLTLTMFGSDSPDIPIDKGTVEFNILVEDWETGQDPHSETI